VKTPKQKTILITGIPRSGTSLVTKLISNQPNTLCFSEPKWLKDIRHDKQCQNEFKDKLLIKLSSIRSEIKKGNPIEITVKKGTLDLPGNYFQRKNNNIQNIKETKSIHVEHSNDLLICVKSNTLFTACYDALSSEKSWQMFPVIRNPLYVLMSWRSLDIPISRGQIKIGEIYSKEIQEIVKEEGLLIKQVKILNWFFKQYTKSKEILRYEEFISSPNEMLKNTFDIIDTGTYDFSTKNNDSHYNSKDRNILQSTLNKYCQQSKQYY